MKVGGLRRYSESIPSYSKGEEISTVLSSERNKYPDNNISEDGNWYVYKGIE